MKILIEIKERNNALRCRLRRQRNVREFGHHIDPSTGQHTPDIRIGCLAAFTARGDFGDDHARCPVAPMIHQLAYPGMDIVAVWNRRAETEGKETK